MSGKICGPLALLLFGHLWWRSSGDRFAGPYFVNVGQSQTLCWNAALLAAFFVVHSLTATARVKKAIGLSDLLYRRAYLFISLITTALVWICWARPPHEVVWQVGLPASLVFYAIQLLGACGFLWTAKHLDAASFLGARKPKSEQLAFHGPYALCRHPTYFFSLCLVVTPYLPVGRALLVAFAALYIAVGSLIEERKLLSQFGKTYARYREKTPWLFPTPRSVKKAFYRTSNPVALPTR